MWHASIGEWPSQWRRWTQFSVRFSKFVALVVYVCVLLDGWKHLRNSEITTEFGSSNVKSKTFFKLSFPHRLFSNWRVDSFKSVPCVPTTLTAKTCDACTEASAIAFDFRVYRNREPNIFGACTYTVLRTEISSSNAMIMMSRCVRVRVVRRK